jgi:hypothetical protein
MANAVKMRVTQALVEANLARWNQQKWVSGEVNLDAETVNECDASFCWFSWAAIAEGYWPLVDEFGTLRSLFYHSSTGDKRYVSRIAQEALELTDDEAEAIWNFYPSTIDEMRDRVESVIRGEWR